MVLFANYEITGKISASQKVTIYQAKRLSDKRPFILKTLNADYPYLHDVAQLKQEYQLLQKVKMPGIARSIDFIKQNNGYAIALESAAASYNLKTLIAASKLGIGQVLTWGIQLAECLEALHKANVIHKGINPYHILTAEGQLQLNRAFSS